MNAHSLQRAVTRAALACLMACLAMPALAQHAAQQQIIRQQHQDMQHRHSNPQHPGYVGGHSSQQQQPRPMPQPPAAPIRGYEVERSYGALAVGPNGNTYEGLGSTPQEAQAKALDECNYQNLDPHSGGGKPCTAIATVANACLGYAKGWSYGDGGDINYTRFYVTPTHDEWHSNFFHSKSNLPRQDLAKQALAMCRAEAQANPEHSCSSSGFSLCAQDSIRTLH